MDTLQTEIRPAWWGYLTPSERRVVLAADAAKAAWRGLQPARQDAVSRATRREAYARHRAATYLDAGR